MNIAISDVWTAAAFVIALQMAAFAWRVSREVNVADKGDINWLPPADIMNLIAMMVAFFGVFILPIVGVGTTSIPVLALGLSIVLFMGYPFALAGHYDLYTRGERSYEPVPRQEKIAIAITLILAALYLIVVVLGQLQ